ncbi:hypothetical protein BTVI_50381 [Pitangus sulphuratus]|nr:hypothetical protein BTVI_50381 [Pitangus sulphuratus]
MQAHLKNCILFWGHQHKKDMLDMLFPDGKSIEEAHKDDQKTGAPLLERQRLSGEENALGRPYISFGVHKGDNKKAGGRLFIMACSDRVTENGFKLKVGMDEVSGDDMA